MAQLKAAGDDCAEVHSDMATVTSSAGESAGRRLRVPLRYLLPLNTVFHVWLHGNVTLPSGDD